MDFKLKRFEKVIEVTRLANIHYFEFTNEYCTVKDRHPFCELVYVDSGSINIESEGFSGVLNKNQLIIHKANETHSLSCSQRNAPNIIIIGFECVCDELEVFSYTPVTLFSESQKLLVDIINEGRNVFLPPYDKPNLKNMKKRKDYIFGADQMIKLKMETFLIELVRSTLTQSAKQSFGMADKSIDPKILGIKSYIDENYKTQINLDTLCFLYYTNKTTICSGFKKNYGMTINTYINKLRIKEAKKLLREGNYTISAIAFMLGYSSVHYFCRVFHKYENQPPSDYIKTVKAKLSL